VRVPLRGCDELGGIGEDTDGGEVDGESVLCVEKLFAVQLLPCVATTDGE